MTSTRVEPVRPIHLSSTRCFFLLALAILLVSWGPAAAVAAEESAADTCRLGGEIDFTGSCLSIAPRRQWDCNYGNEHVNCCKQSPDYDDDGAVKDPNSFWASCLNSPNPDSTDYFEPRDCRCGEHQCSLAGLCGGYSGLPSVLPSGKKLRPRKPVDCLSSQSNSNITGDTDYGPKIPTCDGYCGAASVQALALWQGAYASQGLIRRLGGRNNRDSAEEILIDVYDPDDPSPDVLVAVEELGLGAESWYPEGPYPSGYPGSQTGFLAWVENSLANDNPVIVGVFVKDLDHSKNMQYEHIVPIIGLGWRAATTDREPENSFLVVNDNYSAVQRALPGIGMQSTGTCSEKYCLATYKCGNDDDADTCTCDGCQPTSYGVAVLPPSNVPYPDHPVRINVTGCEGGTCTLNGVPVKAKADGGGPDGWMEPNWTVNQIEHSVFELTATVDSLPSSNSFVVARVNARDAKAVTALEGGGGPFVALPDACYPVEQPGTPFAVGIAHSNQASFFRLEKASDVACPAINQEFVAGTIPANLCSEYPRDDCHVSADASHAQLVIKNKKGTRKDSLFFSMKNSDGTPGGAFGNPSHETHYRFCLYDERVGPESLILETLVPASGSCNKRDCWSRLRGDTGFTFRDLSRQHHGVHSIKLKGRGKTGKGEIRMKARGAKFPAPTLPFSQGDKVTAQLVNAEGSCWSATFSESTRNDETVFRATTRTP